MTKLYMLVGIPGSGKSTWAEENKGKLFDAVFSSDDFREKYFDGVNDQSHNEALFQLLENNLIEYLKYGDACYDATNLSKKFRQKFFSRLGPTIYKIGVIFNLPIEVAKERNIKRLRVVPEKVIEKFYNRFKSDSFEDFDELIIIEV